MQLTPTQIPVESRTIDSIFSGEYTIYGRTKQLTEVVQTLFPPPQRTEKSGLAPQDYFVPA